MREGQEEGGPAPPGTKRKLLLPANSARKARATPARPVEAPEDDSEGTDFRASAVSEWDAFEEEDAAILAAMPSDTEAALRLLISQFQWHGKARVGGWASFEGARDAMRTPCGAAYPQDKRESGGEVPPDCQLLAPPVSLPYLV